MKYAENDKQKSISDKKWVKAGGQSGKAVRFSPGGMPSMKPDFLPKTMPEKM